MNTHDAPAAQQPDSAFTLIELMVALVVLAILLIVAVPSFIDLIRRNQAVAVANEVLSAAQLARSEAIKRMADVNFVITGNSNKWEARVTVGTQIIRTVARGSRPINIDDPRTVTFDFLGRQTPLEPSSITFSHAADATLTRALLIEASGRSCVLQTVDVLCP